MTMDSIEKLNTAIAMIEEARGVPLSASCVVHRGEMLEILQECRTQLVLCTLLDKSGQCSKMVEEIEQLIKEATEL